MTAWTTSRQEYKATQSVRFTPDFHSNPGDQFRAYIANGSNTSAANTAWPEGLYRYGYNGKENDNEVKGVGDQIDYGARIYDARVGRFYSVDPIADQYPELSSYQYASNRPVDGIDLDGLEWSVKTNYDPLTGINNIQFHCKLKISISKNNPADPNAIGKAFVNSFEMAFQGLYDEKRKIKYSGTAEYSITNKMLNDKDYGVDIYSKNLDYSKSFRSGMEVSSLNDPNGGANSKVNSVSALSGGIDTKTRKLHIRPFESIAQTIMHEVGHSVGLKHPFESYNNAQDVNLENYKTGQSIGYEMYRPSIGANINYIRSNIMMYNNINVNGTKASKLFVNPYDNPTYEFPSLYKNGTGSQNLNKFSPDQAFIILQQVTKDQEKVEK